MTRSLTATLTGWAMQRTRRERYLLALLAGILVIAALWGGTGPLRDHRDAAEAAVAEARALQGWLQARRAEMPPLPAPPSLVPGNGPARISDIEASLVAAGLRDTVSHLANTPDGGVALRFDAVAFSRLMPWLDRITATEGPVLTAFRLVATEAPDMVQAELQLDPGS